jgi:hypothetical protein
MEKTSKHAWYWAATWIGTTVAVASCASIPAPTTQLAVSQAAVASAVSAGAPELAPLEMKIARDKLDSANTALAANNYNLARALAEQVEVDAKLAETKARSVKAQKAAALSNDDTRVLREELNRKSK